VSPGAFVRRVAAPVIDVAGTVAALREIPWFVRSWRRYSRLEGAEALRLLNAHPRLGDRSRTTPYDPHYFHQAVWAFERLLARAPERHVDVGSDVNFFGMLSAAIPVTFVDIRPLAVDLPALEVRLGDLQRLPFVDAAVESLSCLHVVEHVGLGRYGDALDPRGTERACRELGRVLAPGGRLYLSAPVGRPRTCFNAHRIHTPRQLLAYLDGLILDEFAVVDDAFRRVDGADLDAAAELEYGCGMFELRAPG
jgi:SAM-dependent methyltransferase